MPSDVNNHKGRIAAAYARDAATNTSGNAWLTQSSDMCWDAVILCAFNAKVISKQLFTKLYKNIHANSYAKYVTPNDTAVTTAADMRKVPQGSFIGFFNAQINPPVLLHAMIATGHGTACGNKNSCVGVGKHVGWELHDLAGKLRWVPGTSGIAAPRGTSSSGQEVTLPVHVYYRTLESVS